MKEENGCGFLALSPDECQSIIGNGYVAISNARASVITHLTIDAISHEVKMRPNGFKTLYYQRKYHRQPFSEQY